VKKAGGSKPKAVEDKKADSSDDEWVD